MALDSIIQAYLQSYATNSSDVVYLARVSEDSWQLIYDGDLSLLVELPESSLTLGIVAELGRPPEAQRLTVYEALLNFSALWHETGGIRAALNGAGGVLLIGEMVLDDLTESGLLAGLEAVRANARLFARLIAGDLPASTADSDDLVMLKI